MARTSASTRRRQQQQRKAVAHVSTAAVGQRWVLLALPTLMVGFYWSGLGDVFSTPKFTVLALAALALVGLTAWRWVDEGTGSLDRSRPSLLLVGVVVAMLITSLLGAALGASLFGELGRNAGVLTYVAGLVLFLVAIAALREEDGEKLVIAVAVAAVPFVLWGLAQVAGMHPIDLGGRAGDDIMSTLGQPNFVGGVAGVLLPFLLWAVVRPPVAWLRVAAGALALGLLVVAAKSASFQAIASIGAGVAVFGLVWGAAALPANRRWAALGGTVLVVVAVAGVFHSRVEEQVRSGLDERVLFWQASGSMIKDRPIAGWGMSGFPQQFSAYRPPAHAIRFGVSQISDAPHDVPLGMFVGGGAILGVLYLAFVVGVGVVLVQGLRRTDGDRRLLLGTVGAGWAAYQAQSLVSIDVPPLIVLHLLLAAGIIVLAGGSRPWPVTLPGARVRGGRRQQLPGTSVAILGATGVAVLVAAWFSLLPWRAEAAHESGLQARANQDLPVALVDLERATSLAPWVGSYWASWAAALAESGDQDAALKEGTEAARRAPSAGSYALSGAQLAERMGNLDEARYWFRFAVAHSPRVPEVNEAYAVFLLARNEQKAALPYLRQAAADKPGNADYQMNLGRTLDALGRRDEAVPAYEAALKVQAGNSEALARLGRTP